jgi:anaerobic magnesium-protoporphyrin IX monomethyl ester cyclase
MALKVLFVEPPKDPWFLMGEYVAPPLGILTLAAFLETKNEKVEIEVVDCQSEKLDWQGLKKRLESFNPEIVVPSALGTCNAFKVLKTVDLTKEVNPNSTTLAGGQHFTALAYESLTKYSDLDIIIRGEAEQTLVELLTAVERQNPLSKVNGISFRHNGKVFHTPNQPLINDLNTLPFPGYHFVRDNAKRYFYELMGGKDKPFAIIEGARGCFHDCLYCSQWRFWGRCRRVKSPKRIADELEYLAKEYDFKLFWLADDDAGLGKRIEELCDEIIRRNLQDSIYWFIQARCDDILKSKNLLSKMRKAGNIWILFGLDSPNPKTLKSFRRNGFNTSDAKETVNLLRQNDIFSQATFIIGERKDSHESIEALREYADRIDPDLATFMTLTPFPGTEVYELSKHNGWIEDNNWENYDMIHAIMPTEFLTREEVQKELYKCYRSYFGSFKRIYQGILSKNFITKRTYHYMFRKALLTSLENLF